jgi:hypothetical protein
MTKTGFRDRPPAPQPGFSKIELVLAVSIPAAALILVLLLAPRIRSGARQRGCQSNLHSIYKGLVSYADENEGKLPPIVETGGRPIWGNQLGSDSNPYGLGHLIRNGYLEDPRVFYCPANTMVLFKQQYSFSTTGAESWMTYRYRNNNAAGHPARWAEIHVPETLNEAGRAIVADDPYLDWYKSAHKTGYNVLYIGGAVKWVGDPKEDLQGDLCKAWELFDRSH